MLGFERDFSQPLLILANSISRLEKIDNNNILSLDVFLKGPVYYGENVTIKGENIENNLRFDLYSGDNPRPSLCCETGKI